MAYSTIDNQYVTAIEQYPDLARLDNYTFSIIFNQNSNDKFIIKYNANSLQIFPRISQNEKDITNVCQFYVGKNFTLLEILHILEIHVCRLNSTEEGITNKDLSELQLAANKLASDITLKTQQINGIQRKMIRCSSSVPDLYHLTKLDEAKVLKSEVVEMKREIESLRADIELETKQFQDYLKLMAEVIKKAKLPKS